VDEEIDVETVLDAADFLIGPCGCGVKRLNPGTDLLLAADWDAVEALRVATEEVPLLSGLPGGEAKGTKPNGLRPARPSFEPPPPAKPEAPGSGVSLAFIIAVSLGTLLVVAGGVGMLMGRNRKNAA
jgi:hypothetical protein